ncbi:MAG: TIGR03557 family F420-dependent LLM class oxidoreductase [Chloroflexi bacterium]|nr:TIGR03557 family F420-dependent LLM class oxidoreductase [Chloroflexota bacterium]
MPQIGYALSSEEHAPLDIVRNAGLAEKAGFDFLSISDHFHPWIDAQGHSGFVWSLIGGIAATTSRIRLGTGVTCPTIRTHPAIIAHAAATAACLMPGRFFLGIGSGENLNEHILGDRWPEVEVRLEMMEEAVEVIRTLWQGGVQSHRGRHYTVENARIYDLPDELPPIVVSASGPKATEVAGRIADGLWGMSPDQDLVKRFDELAGPGKPRYAQVTLCYGKDAAAARRTAHQIWPTAGIKGEASQELPSPKHFEQLAGMVTEDQIAESVPCGPDPAPVLEQVRTYVEAGFDQVYFHQIGPDQQGFIDWAKRELLPAARRLTS